MAEDNQEDKRTWQDLLGGFLQGLADLIDGASQPVFSLIAVTVPFISPIVIAQIVTTALVAGNVLNSIQAKQLAYVLEGIGIVGLSGLVVAIDTWIKSRNKKTEVLIWLLGFIDAMYFLFLVAVIVLLDAKNTEVTPTQTFIRSLISLVPLLSGGIYGYYRIVNKSKIDARDAKAEEYRIRQEKREDRLKAKAIKAGINVFTPSPVVQLNQDVSQVKQQKRDWRLLTEQEKHEIIHVLSVDEIMKKYPVSRSTAFGWKSKKD